MIQNPLSQNTSIFFQVNSQGLCVKIETQRLYIRSYSNEDFESCVALYGDEKLTKFFDHGKPRSRDEVASLIQEKKQYFLEGKPFGLFSIFDKKDMIFVGQVDLIPTEKPGVSEIGCILRREYHNKDFAFEAVKMFMIDYIKEINLKNIGPVYKIVASIHPKNYSSKKLAERLYMTFEKEEERFGGAPRLWYSYIFQNKASISF